MVLFTFSLQYESYCLAFLHVYYFYRVSGIVNFTCMQVSINVLNFFLNVVNGNSVKFWGLAFKLYKVGPDHCLI